VRDTTGPVGLDALMAHAVLDKLNRAVVIFDSTAFVQFANRSAERLSRNGEAISLRERCLTFLDGSARVALQEYLARCLDGGGSGRRAASIVLRVPAAEEEQSPYWALISPLELETGSADPASSWHLLMLYAPHAQELPKRILRELYRMSAAEADLAELLFGGLSLEEAAVRQAVSVNTVKSQLRQIFVKCSVHSRAELMQLLALGPRTL
jgi:DNA-binding CsgD family transcriptional regulator